MKLISLFFLLMSFTVQAKTLSEDFSTTTQKESSTAVWNTALGVIHPNLQVRDYEAPPGGTVSTTAFSVGDGRDGIFDSTTYANFGVISGTTIIIDANVHPILQVTSFQLDNTHSLTSINGPLIIYSLSTVNIDGTILCSGENGFSAVGVNGGAGGSGRCGGMNGGAGGNVATSGTAGLPIGGLVSGGGGGNYVGAALGAGGGAGGAYSGNPGAPGANSNPVTNLGGAGGNGAAGADHDFKILNGSPSGGGGSGSNTEGGGGGGGGGGIVIIHAVGDVTLSATGFILATGGNGGGANSGGGGGGGGGGSVKIFTPKNFALVAGTPIDVNGGIGGIPAVVNAGDGGTGSFGRTWDNYSTFSGAGSESHGSVLFQIGVIEYLTTPEIAISKSYDTQSTLTKFESITTNPTSSDVSFEIAASNDNFASDDSGWVNLSQIGSLEKKRYVKFKMTLTNSNPATPTEISAVSINFDPGQKENFQFKSGCGLMKTPPTSGPNVFSLLMTLMLMFLPLVLVLKLKLNLKLIHAKK